MMRRCCFEKAFHALIWAIFFCPAVFEGVAAAGGLQGFVFDAATGVPIAEAEVFSIDGQAYDFSDAAGAYALDLPPGAVTVLVHAGGYQTQWLETVIPSESPVETDFHLEPAAQTAVLFGQVSDCMTGRPLSQALIETDEGHYTYTNNNGAYWLTLPPGGYILSVWQADGYFEEMFTVEIDPTAAETVEQHFCLFSVEQTAAVSGAVCDRVTGLPLGDVCISAFDDRFFAFSDDSGRFVLDLPAGDVTLEFRNAGYTSAYVGFHCGAGQSTDLTVHLDPLPPDDHSNHADEATSLRLNGGPMEGCIEKPGDADWFTVKTDAAAVFSIETFDLGPGSDTVLQVFAADAETLLAADDDSGAGGGSKALVSSGGADRFYVRVNHYFNFKTGSYRIAVRGADDFCDAAGPCAAELALDGAVLAGAIETAGDTDWFQLPVEAGLNYRVETFDLSAGFDTTAALHDADGAVELLRDDDSGPGYGSALMWTAGCSGTVYVQVSAFDAASMGTYSIRAAAFDDHTDAPDGTAAVLAPYGPPIEGRLETPADLDWFRFHAVPGEVYSLQACGVSAPAGPALALYSAEGEPIAEAGPAGACTRLIRAAEKGGTLFVRIAAPAGDGFGGYTLEMRAEDDHADTFDWATPLTADGRPVQGRIETLSDADCFQFSADAESVYRVEVFDLQAADAPLIEIFSADGGAPRVVDDTGTAVCPIEEAGTYYVRTGGLPGDYTLRVSLADDHCDEAGSCAVILAVDGTGTDGRFEVSDDTDWFRFPVQPNQRYRIAAVPTGGRCDPILALYGAGPDRLPAADDDGGDGLAAAMIWKASAAGDVYLCLQDFNAAPLGRYRVSVAQLPGDDVADDPGTAPEMVPDAAAVGARFDFAGDEDWFFFEAAGGETFSLETSRLSDGCDTVLTLYRDQGATLLWRDDDGGAGLASRLAWTAPAAGIYHLQVRHADADGTGAYEVAVRRLQPDALSLNVGQTLRGALAAAGGSDLYRLDAGAGGVITVTLAGPRGADFDLYLKSGHPPGDDFYDVRGYRLSAQETCSWPVVHGERLFIRVQSYSGAGDYSLVAELRPPPACIEMPTDDIQSGTLNSSGDHAFYCVTVSAEDRLMVRLDGPPDGADFDLFLRHGAVPTQSAYDAAGQDASAGAVLGMTAPADGTVFIGVFSHQGAGAFSLQAVLDRSRPVCRLLNAGEESAGTLRFAQDRDLYRMAAPAGSSWQIQLSGPADADFDLLLKAENPPSDGDWDRCACGTGAQEQIECTLPADGPVYVMVRSHWGAGTYTLRAEDAGCRAAGRRAAGPADKMRILYGTIEDRATGRQLAPSRFCLHVKGLRKFCYAQDSPAESELAWIPGGYFLLPLPQLVGEAATLQLQGVAGYQDAAAHVSLSESVCRVTLKCTMDPFSDNDADGILTGWEKRYGLNPWKNDADLDPDGDGFSNFAEYRADTDPLDKSAVPSAGKRAGDLDASGRVDAADVMAALQTAAGMTTGCISATAVCGSGRCGLREAVFVLQRAAGQR